MTKILFVSNIAGEKVSNFTMSSLKAAKELGMEFHMAANWSKASPLQRKKEEKKYGISLHHIDFVRNPLHPLNIRAYYQMMQLMKQENYDIVHCNTPIGGVIGRLCAHRIGIKNVLYMAHGFHFYKGAPIVNRLIYKGVEKTLARKTDVLATMNKEDFEASQQLRLRDGQQNYFFVNGVGLDVKKYKALEIDREKQRAELGLTSNDIMAIAMGDLIKRKNYESSIKALAKVNHPNLHFFICGEGPKMNSLKEQVDSLHLTKNVHFLGFRKDVGTLLKCSDMFLFTSFQEGLARSLMEAMSVGLPCVCSKIRGNVDLIEDGVGGFLSPPDDIDGLAEGIKRLVEDESLREQFGETNLHKIEEYSIENVVKQLQEIYKTMSLSSSSRLEPMRGFLT